MEELKISGASGKSVVTQTPDRHDMGVPHFRSEDMKDAVSQRGYNCYVEKALKCPCSVKGAGSPLSTCQNCGGSSWFFINRKQTRLMMQSINFMKKFANWTEENYGTVSVTARPEDKLCYMDRIIVLDLETHFSEIIRPDSHGNKVFAFLTYVPTEVIEIYMFEGEDKPLKILKEVVDYKLINNTIEFDKKYLNSSDMTVTIYYKHHPVYHVIDIDRDVSRSKEPNNCATPKVGERQSLRDLPLHCIAKRPHLILDADNFSSSRRLFDNTNNVKYPDKH